MSKVSKEELLAKARKPAETAMKLHPFYRGKIEVCLKSPVRSYSDFAVWYTPGVAEPCKVIEKDMAQVYEMTNKGNAVAIVSNGTRVLGLGNIGPEASLPVMEGKALLFKYLGGVDAYPICLDCTGLDELVSAVKWIQPSFGGVNLEDIEQPLCFELLDRLRAEARIPVWHDDQQGTATIMLAGAINALKLVGKKMDQIQVAIVGSGAAGICTARLLFAAGVKPENSFMVDSKGILHPGRTELKERYPQKWEMCLKTNSEGRTGGIDAALKDVDLVVSMSTPGPGIIKPEWVKRMASDSIVLSLIHI